MDDERSKDIAHRRLEQVTARLRAHPLNSDEFTRAREVVRVHADQGREAVEGALRAEDLPSPGKQSRMLLFGLPSLARLNRKRIELERRAGITPGTEDG